ncbi:Biphenyl dioxygenase subunit beta [Frankia sp. Hr75.2]|nr:Biphenyl dioxygenase subunit beta [Frankia sp. Hr75.2]
MSTYLEARPSGVPLAGNVTPETHYAIEQFLYAEAELLDDEDFGSWLQLIAEDMRYWAPVRMNRLYRERKKSLSPPGESAYFDETRAHLVQRVDRLKTRMAWAEDPPSRTRHLITNVRVRSTAQPDEFIVGSAFYVHRTRMERDLDSFVGKREDLLRRTDTESGYEIARRTVVFDVSTLLAKNLSIFF